VCCRGLRGKERGGGKGKRERPARVRSYQHCPPGGRGEKKRRRKRLILARFLPQSSFGKEKERRKRRRKRDHAVSATLFPAGRGKGKKKAVVLARHAPHHSHLAAIKMIGGEREEKKAACRATQKKGGDRPWPLWHRQRGGALPVNGAGENKRGFSSARPLPGRGEKKGRGSD